MMVLIVGTPDSGKSFLAEELSEKLAVGNKKYYVATMIPFGKEGMERVKKHRNLRSGKGFVTLEWPDDFENRLDEAIDFSNATVLLECMSNLIGNEMHKRSNQNKSDDLLVKRIVSEVCFLKDKAKNIIVVSNEFPLEDEKYNEDTKRYVRLVAEVNAELRKLADEFYLKKDGEWKKNETY